MAIDYFASIDLNKNELQNAVLQNESSISGAVEGQIYYDTDDNQVKVCTHASNGSFEALVFEGANDLFTGLSDVTPTTGDKLLTLDSNGSTEQTTTVDALATLFAGSGLTATNGVIAVDTLNQDTSGTAAIATTVTVADESSDTTCFPLFVTAATGNLAPKSGTNLAFNSSSGLLTATAFAGDLTGDVTGNADTATKIASITNSDIVQLNTTTTQTGTKTFSGVIDITNTTDSSDATGDTGALRVEGGASIAKKLYVGTDLDVDGTTNLDAVDIDGDVDIAGDLTFSAAKDILITDNSATALEIKEGSNLYMRFVTTNSSESILIQKDLSITGNLTVNGTTTTVNSTTVTIDDPIFTLGGDTAPGSDDDKDRGIEFRYHDGSAARIGFFGWDDSAGVFTGFTEATNSSEVFSGDTMNAVFGTIGGTLTTAAQTGITSVGTLTTLLVDNIRVNGTTIGHSSLTDALTFAASGDIITVKDGAYNFDIASHDGTNGLSLGGTVVTATAAELNLLDGVSGLVQADLTKLAAVDSTATELNMLDAGTSGSSVTLADGDSIIIGDASASNETKKVLMSDIATYIGAEGTNTFAVDLETNQGTVVASGVNAKLITVTHSLSSLDVMVTIVEKSTGATVFMDVLRNHVDTITIETSGDNWPASSAAYRVLIQKIV